METKFNEAIAKKVREACGKDRKKLMLQTRKHMRTREPIKKESVEPQPTSRSTNPASDYEKNLADKVV